MKGQPLRRKGAPTAARHDDGARAIQPATATIAGDIYTVEERAKAQGCLVTGSNMLARAIGSSLGVAILGAVANSIVAAPGTGHSDPATIITSARGVFPAVLICGILWLCAAAAMPRKVVTVR